MEFYSMLQVVKLLLYLQLTMNKLSNEMKLFIILFKLAQIIKFALALGKTPVIHHSWISLALPEDETHSKLVFYSYFENQLTL